MNQRKTILHIINNLGRGGAETMLADIVNQQVKQAEVNIIIINKIYTHGIRLNLRVPQVNL